MPTENRSSNTEMVSESEMTECQFHNNCGGWCETRRELEHNLCEHCLESHDEEMAEQAPAPQPHPEPIAWMVGTAFWWTKEEAERDAAATGLPIVGLGPMNDRAAIELAESETLAAMAELAECETMADMVAEREWAEHVGTGDVSSKVEAAFTQLHNDLHEAGEKLAERDVLLQRALPYLSNTPDLVQHGAEDLAQEIRSASAGKPCYGPNEWGTECGQCSKCESASAEPEAQS